MRANGVRWTRTREVIAATAVTFCGILLSAGAAVALRQAQIDQAQERMDGTSAAVQTAVADRLSRYVDAVAGAAAVLSARPEPDAAAFGLATRPLTVQELPGARAVTLTVVVDDGAVAATQARWRARGATGLVLHPQPGQPQHVFGVLSRRLDGTLGAPTGVDAGTTSAVTAVLRHARDTRGVAVSDPYVLLADRALPPARQQLSFLLAAPVGPAGRAPTGYLLLSIRGTDFLTATLDQAAHGTLNAELSVQTADGKHVRLAAAGRPGADADLRRELVVPVAHRLWTIRTSADDRTMMPPSTRADLAVAGAGSLLSVLFGLLLLIQVTGRRRAEAAVRAATAEARAAQAQASAQAELLGSVMNSIGDAVGVVDDSGTVVIHNPAAAALLGTVPPGIRASDWPAAFGLFRADGVTPFPSAEMPLAHALAGEPHDDVPMVVRNALHPDGAVITVSARPVDTPGGRRAAVAVCRDITERTRADRELAAATARLQEELAQRRSAEAQLRSARDALAEQRAYLAQVLDALETSVVTCDNAGRIQHANLAARAGASASPVGLHYAEAARLVDLRRPDGGPVQEPHLPLTRALRGTVVTGEEFTTRRAGRQHRIATHARPLRNDAGEITGAVVLLYDVTALREREADLTAFAGVVAHDLNSPLAGIGGYAELLDEELAAAVPGPEGAAARSHLGRLRGTVDRMRRLIEDLLAYTAAGDAKLSLSTVDLRAVVDDVVTTRLETMLARPGGEVVAPDVFIGPLPPIKADAAMIRQLIDNLIGNALKYTPPGQPARIDVTAEPDGTPGFVRVQIADRGIGIPDGQHHAIFEGFHRAHHGAGYVGTGLGLAICQRVVERHGGTIGVTDNPGGGARFHLTLPVATGPSGTAATSDRPPGGVLAPR